MFFITYMLADLPALSRTSHTFFWPTSRTGNLDSTTGTRGDHGPASLAVGKGGRTVIVVTHDAEIAGRAERVLRMHDGKLLPPLEDARTVVGSRASDLLSGLSASS